VRAIQIEQFGDPAQVLRVVDIDEPPRRDRVLMRFY
jgi:NADPH:quinone reductase-like Zn-dependent oxidoreductase